MTVFENNVKSVMKSKGLKHKYVAEKIGVSEKLFSAMLNGRKAIKVSDVLLLCEVLEATPNQLFGYDE